MKISIKKILLLSICAIFALVMFAACSNGNKTVTVKVDKFGQTVTSNGGLNVQYGDYVYFVNGYAGESVDNTYGNVVLGGIYRAKINEGVLDTKSSECVVPKNIYGASTTYPGIYIVNDYIYYNTPNVEKNSKGEQKTSQGVLTRTKVDGTDSRVISKYTSNATVLYAGDNSNYLFYEQNLKIYSLNTKTLKSRCLVKNASGEDTDALAYKCSGDYVIYTTRNFGNKLNASSDYRVYLLNLKTGEETEIMNAVKFNGNDTDKTIYQVEVKKLQVTKNNNKDEITVFYTKTDNTSNKSKSGFFSYTFTEDNLETFNLENEKRYTLDTSTNAYTDFIMLKNGYVVAAKSDAIHFFDTNSILGGLVQRLEKEIYNVDTEDPTISISLSSFTVKKYLEDETKVILYYEIEKKLYAIKLFNIQNNVYTFAKENVVTIFTGSFESTYCTYEFEPYGIYYINSDMGNYVYFCKAYDLGEYTSETDISKGNLLSVIAEKDELTLLGISTTTEG